jgi:hypothetical protein
MATAAEDITMICSVDENFVYPHDQKGPEAARASISG